MNNIEKKNVIYTSTSRYNLQFNTYNSFNTFSDNLPNNIVPLWNNFLWTICLNNGFPHLQRDKLICSNDYKVGECGNNYIYVPSVLYWQIQVDGIQKMVQILQVNIPIPLDTGTSGSESHLLSPLSFAEAQGHSHCNPLAVQQNGVSSQQKLVMIGFKLPQCCIAFP